MKRKIFSAKGFLSLLVAAVAISGCNDDDELTGPPSLYVGEVTTFFFAPTGETKIIELQTNVEVSLNTQSTASWCEASLLGKTLTVTVGRNATFATRSTTVEVYIPGKSETLTFEQGGQPVAKIPVDTAHASSEQPGYPITNSYDGVTTGDHYHSAWGAPGGPFELVYELQSNPVLELAMITYYPRPKSVNTSTGVATCPNGTFGVVSIAVSVNNGPFETVKQGYAIGDPVNAAASYPDPAYIELDAPVANVTAVKITVDGLSSKANLASCNEMEFYGTGSPAATEPYLVPSKSSHDFTSEGGSTIISLVTNAKSLTASGAGWCTAVINESFITIAASENSSGAYREADITITGDNGATTQIKVTQPRIVDEGKEVTVDFSSPDSYADSWIPDDGETDGITNGPFANVFDNNYDTYWHSNYDEELIETNGPISAPHNLYFHLTSASSLSYIAYYPRDYPNGGNGNWGNIEVYVKRSGSGFEYIMSYNCEGKGSRSQIVMPEVLTGVTDVRIRITSQQNSSCSEIKFFSN
ncbi:MAG: hypothetical protein LBK18_03965 [Prevotellaceae bacterium]|jgi:hypothetical protein|nr:hypothetical protein [Prevotellaceae bacterium]